MERKYDEGQCFRYYLSTYLRCTAASMAISPVHHFLVVAIKSMILISLREGETAVEVKYD